MRRFLEDGYYSTYAIANVPPLLAVPVKLTPPGVLGPDDRDILSVEVEPWRGVRLVLS